MDDIPFKNTILRDIWKFLTNRLFVLAVAIVLSFYFLAANIFDLQIVNGASYIKAVAATYHRELTVPASRGTIYDKFGRPLAVNDSAYSIKIDPSTATTNANEMLYALIKLFEANEQKYIDDFPISLHEPYTFEFQDSPTREANWKRDMDVPKELTASETIAYLREYFKVPAEMSALEARKLLSLRSVLYLQRFAQYNTVTVAYNVNMRTMVELEERSREFPGVFVDVESLRTYPAGQYVSHILGYIGRITEDDYKANKSKGYTEDSKFGRSGLERAFESELRGVDGTRLVETTGLGAVIRTIDSKPPVQGNKIFLTLDSQFQAKVFHMLEDTLRETLKNKLTLNSAREKAVTLQDFFISMVNANTISFQAILDARPDSDSYAVREYILSVEPEANVLQQDDTERAKMVKAVIADGITGNKIRPLTMLLVMLEQNLITGDEEFVARLKNGRLTPLSAVLQKIDEREITPQMANIDPSTGSVVVLDVNTGAVIAAVGYPTFDNNEFVNNFNNEYYYKLLRDPTAPMRNRPFMEARAPGSTFKMISALAALEGGSISPTTTIYDELSFTKAGRPYTRCYAGYSHGRINVVSALAVSCNYFFCDAIYLLGNSKAGGQGIDILNRLMVDFGLNDRAGVEVYEWADEIKSSIANNDWPTDTPIISAAQYKEYTMKLYNPDVAASDYSWFDGDTVKTSIGQANNAYSALSMAKYVATLATGGVRRQSHLLDTITTQTGEPVRTFKPTVEFVMDIAPENLDTIYNGMLAVIENPQGTAYNEFRDFPIRIAGKTGTAQESSLRNEHSSFAAFAPFEDPQIAVYVLLPYGDTRALSHASARLARQVIEEYMGLNTEPEYAPETNTFAQ